MLGQILVHHKHVLTLPDAFGEVKMMTSKAYSIKQFWYVDIEVAIPDAKHLQYQGRVWQVPIIRGSAKSTDHKENVVDLLKQIYDASAKLSDIGITLARSAKVYQLVAGMSAGIPPNEAKRKQLEAQVSDLRATERVAEAITLLQEREKNVQKQEKELKSSDQPLYIQVIDTFPPNPDSIWEW